MKQVLPLLLVALVLLASRGQAEDTRALPSPTGLLCDLLGDRGLAQILDPKPEFSWEVRSDRPASTQSAYQIQVAEEKGGPVHPLAGGLDSGKVRSNRSIAVARRIAGSASASPNRKGLDFQQGST